MRRRGICAYSPPPRLPPTWTELEEYSKLETKKEVHMAPGERAILNALFAKHGDDYKVYMFKRAGWGGVWGRDSHKRVRAAKFEDCLSSAFNEDLSSTHQPVACTNR